MYAVLIKNVDNYFRGGGGEGWLVVIFRASCCGYIADVKIYIKDKLCGKCFLENRKHRFYYS